MINVMEESVHTEGGWMGDSTFFTHTCLYLQFDTINA